MKQRNNSHTRDIMRSKNLNVKKLVRLAIGPFKLGTLKSGEIKLADKKEIKEYENYIRSF